MYTSTWTNYIRILLKQQKGTVLIKEDPSTGPLGTSSSTTTVLTKLTSSPKMFRTTTKIPGGQCSLTTNRWSIPTCTHSLVQLLFEESPCVRYLMKIQIWSLLLRCKHINSSFNFLLLFYRTRYLTVNRSEKINSK